MTAITISAGELKAGLGAFQDVIAAYKDGFANVPEDEQVLFDGIKIAAPLVGGAFGALAPVLGPVIVFALVWAIEHNTQGRPGSQTPMHNSGGRGGAGAGSRIEEDDGA